MAAAVVRPAMGNRRPGPPRAGRRGHPGWRVARHGYTAGMRYAFAEFTLDLITGELSGPTGPVALRRQTFLLLEALLRQAPALIDRDLLIDQVWGRSALSRNVLPQAISELRQALGDDPAAPRFIETRHRRGYRFIADVQLQPLSGAEASADAAPAAAAAPSMPPKPSRAVHTGLLALAAALAIGLTLLFLRSGAGGEPQAAASPAALDATLARLSHAADDALANHRPERASAALRAMLELRPEAVDLRLRLAETELAALQGHLARATLAGLPSDHISPTAQRLRARIARYEGRGEEARELSRAAVELAIEQADADALLAALREWLASLRAVGALGEADAALSALMQAQMGLLGETRTHALQIERLVLLRERGALAEAQALAAELPIPVEPALALRREIELGLLESEAGDHAKALERLQAAASAPEARAPALALQLDNALGVALLRQGAVEAARERFESGFAAARRQGAGAELAGLQVNAGLMFARQRRLTEAEPLWTQALAAFEALGDQRGQAVVLGNLAAAASAQGQAPRADELNLRALALFRQMALEGPRARTAYNLGLSRARAGEPAAAEALFEEAALAYASAGQNDLLLHVTASRIDLLLERADAAGAQALLDALPAGASAPPASEAVLSGARGRLALAVSDLESARYWLDLARQLHEEARQERWVAQLELELLRLGLLEDHSPVEVGVAAEALATRFAGWDEPRPQARALLLLGEALLSQNRTAEARQALREARQAAARFPELALELDLAWAEAWAATPSEFEPRLLALQARAETHGNRRVQALAQRTLQQEESPAPAAPLPPYARTSAGAPP